MVLCAVGLSQPDSTELHSAHKASLKAHPLSMHYLTDGSFDPAEAARSRRLDGREPPDEATASDGVSGEASADSGWHGEGGGATPQQRKGGLGKGKGQKRANGRPLRSAAQGAAAAAGEETDASSGSDASFDWEDEGEPKRPARANPVCPLPSQLPGSCCPARKRSLMRGLVLGDAISSDLPLEPLRVPLGALGTRREVGTQVKLTPYLRASDAVHCVPSRRHG